MNAPLPPSAQLRNALWPTPAIDAVYALIRRRAIEAGCYQPAG